MSHEPLLISVRINSKSFRDFAVFDVLKRQKRWISPTVFSLILLFSSVLCLTSRTNPASGMLPGIVLLVIALGLPAVYFCSFFSSVRRQCQKMKLEKPVFVYTIELSATKGVGFCPKDSDTTTYTSWEALHGAYRTKTAIYLYLSPQRACLMPEQLCGCAIDDIWAVLEKQMEKKKLHVL